MRLKEKEEEEEENKEIQNSKYKRSL